MLDIKFVRENPDAVDKSCASRQNAHWDRERFFELDEERPLSVIYRLLDKGKIRGMAVLDFQDELAECLGKPVDVVTTAGASQRFLDKIRKDEVVLYESR